MNFSNRTVNRAYRTSVNAGRKRSGTNREMEDVVVVGRCRSSNSNGRDGDHGVRVEGHHRGDRGVPRMVLV
jgi:hypothetical protein